MPYIVFAAAATASILHHYVFSFQRFTLAVARNTAGSAQDVGELQTLMTPALMGALGWLSHLFVFGAAIWLVVASAWWVGLAYVLADMVVLGGVMPLFPARRHFAALASQELSRYLGTPGAPLAQALLQDVGRLGSADGAL